MTQILAVANQKGGVGKTTTAVNLAASLGALEKRVLIADMDAQGNATSSLGIRPDLEKSVYPLLLGEGDIHEAILDLDVPNTKLLAAVDDLVGFEIEGLDLDQREFRLKRVLANVQDEFDYIIIDAPPSLGLLTLNALVAAQGLLLPLQTEYFAMEGMGKILNTLELVKEALNPELSLYGVLLTLIDRRNSLARQVESEVREHFGKKVFQTVIPRNVRLSEAPSFGKPVILYDIRSKGAESYLSLAREVLDRHTQDTAFLEDATVPDSRPQDARSKTA